MQLQESERRHLGVDVSGGKPNSHPRDEAAKCQAGQDSNSHLETGQPHSDYLEIYRFAQLGRDACESGMSILAS